MTKFLAFAGTAIAGVVVGLLLSASGVSFGGVYNQVNNTFREGIKVGPNDEFKIDSTGGLRSDKSTFCFDFYATSTATRVKMTASSTATIEGTDGVMVTAYGSCP